LLFVLDSRGASTQRIPADVLRGAMQPGGDLRFPADSLRLWPEQDKDRLGRIFRVGTGQHSPAHAQHQARMSLYHRRERFLR
jgi:hypothetical protein